MNNYGTATAKAANLLGPGT